MNCEWRWRCARYDSFVYSRLAIDYYWIKWNSLEDRTQLANFDFIRNASQNHTIFQFIFFVNKCRWRTAISGGWKIHLRWKNLIYDQICRTPTLVQFPRNWLCIAGGWLLRGVLCVPFRNAFSFLFHKCVQRNSVIDGPNPECDTIGRRLSAPSFPFNSQNLITLFFLSSPNYSVRSFLYRDADSSIFFFPIQNYSYFSVMLWRYMPGTSGAHIQRVSRIRLVIFFAWHQIQ